MKQKNCCCVYKGSKGNKNSNKNCNMNKFNSFLIGLISIGIGGLIMYFYMNRKQEVATNEIKSSEKFTESREESNPNEGTVIIAGQPVDLRQAAQRAVKGVVHVKTLHNTQTYERNPFFDFFYGYSRQRPSRQVVQAGSGVIISADGYIITNNHVIKGAEKISVTLNDNRQFIATLVGNDENTDLALLKIDSVSNLTVIPFANSDEVALGEWVLAVGNPFDLTSTVTSGIVSAKARSIKKNNKKKLSLDAFIQTDAAVNSGNSGGALVNSKGRLIGINTAIESSTGAYIGYSFAIPSNIVSKVTQDLRKYGKVQRAFLGVQISPVTDALVKEYDLKKIEGVFIRNMFDGGAAQNAGLQINDIILAINNKKVNSVEELQEQVGKYSPDDTIKVQIRRNGLDKIFDVHLRGALGEDKITEISFLGAKLKSLDRTNLSKFSFPIQNGVQIMELKDGGRLYKIGVKRGFVIQRVNNVAVHTVEDINQILQQNVLRGMFWVEGVYPDGKKINFKLS